MALTYRNAGPVITGMLAHWDIMNNFLAAHRPIRGYSKTPVESIHNDPGLISSALTILVMVESAGTLPTLMRYPVAGGDVGGCKEIEGGR